MTSDNAAYWRDWAERAEAERDKWKARWSTQRETYRELWFEGVSVTEWHERHCAAMQGTRIVEAERDQARADYAALREGIEALAGDYDAYSLGGTAYPPAVASRLRALLAAHPDGLTQAEREQCLARCACGHPWEMHGPEVPGCCECRCRKATD